MKLSFSLGLVLLAGSSHVHVSGFMVAPPVSPTRLVALNAEARPDASAAVEEALKITASFGIDSNEAKVAWDIVEEMDASDNSEATKASLTAECDPLEPTPECVDYGKFLDELYILRNSISHKDSNKMSLADTLKSIKLTTPEGKSGEKTNSPELDKALLEARSATEKFGVTSPEARLAWETYEEIASSGNENAYVGVSLTEECDLESGLEACQAMEELQRVMPVLFALQK